MRIDLETCRVLRRPLIGVALSAIGGMLAASSGLFSFHLLLGASLLNGVLAILFFRSKTSGRLIFCFVALVSACRFILGASAGSEVEINQIQPQLPLKKVQLIGRVAGAAEFYTYRSGGRGTWVFPLHCEGLKTSIDWVRTRGRIQIRISGASPEESFHQGERIHFWGELCKHDFPMGDPIMLIASNNGALLSEPCAFSPIIAGQRLREKAAARLSIGMENHPDQLAVLKALLLGYRKAIPPEIYQSFMRTGTLHIFAISGLHVGMLGLLITIGLKTLGISRDRWGIWLLPLLLIYVISTGMKSSALRAFTMAAVYFLSPFFHRKPDVPTAIAFAALLLLFLNPLEILSAGFLFSFTVVSFLVMAFAVVPKRFIHRGEGWVRTVWAYVASLIITSVAAFIASVPITALFFGSFSPVSLLGNLIVVPLTFCVVLSGWLSILLPVASEIFNHAAGVFIQGLLITVNTLANLPGAHQQVTALPLWAVFFWYLGWLRFFVHARTPQQRLQSLSFIALAIIWSFLF